MRGTEEASMLLLQSYPFLTRSNILLEYFLSIFPKDLSFHMLQFQFYLYNSIFLVLNPAQTNPYFNYISPPKVPATKDLMMRLNNIA